MIVFRACAVWNSLRARTPRRAVRLPRELSPPMRATILMTASAGSMARSRAEAFLAPASGTGKVRDSGVPARLLEAPLLEDSPANLAPGMYHH